MKPMCYLVTTVLLLFACVLPAEITVSGSAGARFPAKLNVNDTISLTSGGSLVIRFSNAASVNLTAPASGKIVSEGLNLDHGTCFFRLKKLPERFLIRAALAVFAGNDGQFFLQSDLHNAKVVVVLGELRVLTRDKKTTRLQAGETMIITETSSEIRKSRRDDIAFWKNEPVQLFDKVKLPEKIPRRFGEIYIYNMVVLEQGGGTVFFPDPDLVPQSASSKDLMVSAGSRIVTGASETASLRLGEKTLVKIAPDSEILLKSSFLEVLKGTCLIRHGQVVLPVKIGGPVPLLVARGSSVELTKVDQTIVATIYNGSLQLPKTSEWLNAGSRFRVSPKGAEKLDYDILPVSPFFQDHAGKTPWSPDIQLFNEGDSESDPFSFIDERSEKPVTQQQPSPGSLLQQYEIQPEGAR